MKLLQSLRSYLPALFRRSQVNAEMDDEMLSHIELRADDLERLGMSRGEAQRQARIEFGGYQRVKEECHESAGGTFLESLAKDIRYSVRMLRKSPGFTVVAVGTLALAIGANAVVFAALNAVILRPLNVPHAESLYSIHRVGDNAAAQSYPDYLDYRDRSRSFEGLMAYGIQQAALDTSGDPARVWLFSVSGNYFDALGIQPSMGRVFHSSDEHGVNSAPYIVLSQAYWHTHFHDDPGIVGRVVQLNKHPFTIIGVAPQGFHGTLLFATPDLFLPMVNQQQVDGANTLNERGNLSIFMMMGHLKPGVTPAAAASELQSISGVLEKTYPKDHRYAELVLARPGLYGDYMGRPVRAFLAALMLLAGLILLGACANLGSLFASRAADRSREVALRLALGATRARVLRQLFTEALLISLCGGAFGLWGSIVLLRWMSAWQPFPQFPLNVPVSPDANVYIVALLLALASGFLFGVVPVRQVLRTSPYEIVKAGASNMHRRPITGRDLLVILQVAICAVLVTSSIVAVRGLLHSIHGNFGFDPKNVLLVNASLEMAGYSANTVPAMQKRILDSVAGIAGVESVGMADWVPLSNGDTSDENVFADGTTDLRPANSAANSVVIKVSPEYFQASGTALLSGRPFSWHDDERAPRVAVVDREFARKVLGSESAAVGRHYKLRDGTRVEVVGLVEDGKYATLTEPARAVMFLPVRQSPSIRLSLIVRSPNDPQQLTAAIKDKLHELDPGLPCYIQTWDEALNLPLFPSRVAVVALGILGIMGAMLSITGIFGMAAYSVSKRLKELGIRIALGAKRQEVLAAALGRPLKLLGFGSAAGLLLGMLASRVLASIVYQATPRDPLVLAGAVLTMLLLGLFATWIPAQRALSVDPLRLLREE
jgi:predicted permease